ncbi:MAG: hypothetical protein ACREBC_21395 [Pyrinomonadaceae bacterium]
MLLHRREIIPAHGIDETPAEVVLTSRLLVTKKPDTLFPGVHRQYRVGRYVHVLVIVDTKWTEIWKNKNVVKLDLVFFWVSELSSGITKLRQTMYSSHFFGHEVK